MRLERAIVHGIAYLLGSFITAAAVTLVLALFGIVT